MQSGHGFRFAVAADAETIARFVNGAYHGRDAPSVDG
jgi:hypothetical protein